MRPTRIPSGGQDTHCIAVISQQDALTDRGSLRSARLYTCRALYTLAPFPPASLQEATDRRIQAACRTYRASPILALAVTPHRGAVLALRNPWQACYDPPLAGNNIDFAVNACKAGRWSGSLVNPRHSEHPETARHKRPSHATLSRNSTRHCYQRLCKSQEDLPIFFPVIDCCYYYYYYYYFTITVAISPSCIALTCSALPCPLKTKPDICLPPASRYEHRTCNSCSQVHLHTRPSVY